MANNRYDGGTVKRRLINVLDDINDLKARMEGTEQLLLALYEAFRLSNRTLEDFVEAVLAIQDTIKGNVGELQGIGDEIKAVMEGIDR